MQRGDEAGLSAREQAARMRAKARRLEEAADRYQQGAAGEEATARLLARLDQSRFRVFHDLRLPGSRANVDHVVVGPTGLFVVDSKNYTSRVSVNKDTLWCGRYPQTKRLETAHWEAAQVVEALRLDGDDVPVPTVVLCIHGVELPFTSAEVGGALVVAPSFLLGAITRRAARLTPEQCARLEASVQYRLYGVPMPAPPVQATTPRGIVVVRPPERPSWWARLQQRVSAAR
ncbi:MAG TPA: nuclease-related domain-containing protein [Acidimicrobiales bacterium]|nr:nuclease-related domain-containing protein [Acidimicrobiales bacterium]